MGDDAEADIAGDEVSLEAPLGSLSFTNLDETDVDEFCHDLLIALGFVNVDWRKGTPKKASPADRDRDLIAQRERVDVDEHRPFEPARRRRSGACRSSSTAAVASGRCTRRTPTTPRCSPQPRRPSTSTWPCSPRSFPAGTRAGRSLDQTRGRCRSTATSSASRCGW